MRIERRDLRHGVVAIRCENLDDLWYLSQTLSAGDRLRGKSQRRIKDKQDTKSSGGERKTVTLTIRVEKVEFKSDAGTLRVSGIIIECIGDDIACGSHHTFSVDAGTSLTICKDRWNGFDLDRLNDAVKSTLRPRVLVVSLEEGEAVLGLIRESKTDYYDLNRNIGGKYDVKGRESRKGDFYAELTILISSIMGKENVSHVILSGPGFEKGNYHRYLKENKPEISAKCLIEDTGMGGEAGIQEVLKRDAINRTLEEVNAVRDIRYVEDILKQIGKDTGLAAYGGREVQDAVRAGAADLLLVSDLLFGMERDRVELLMAQVRNGGGKTHIINHECEAGQKLDALGGIAAKLRYRLG
jgi:protein pelota